MHRRAGTCALRWLTRARTPVPNGMGFPRSCLVVIRGARGLVSNAVCGEEPPNGYFRLYDTSRFQINQHRAPRRKLPNKFVELARRLKPLIPQNEWREAPVVQHADMLRSHSPAYVDQFLRQRLSAAQERRIGLKVDDAVVERVLRVTGGTVEAALSLFRDSDALRCRDAGFGRGTACLGGGSHHAHFDFGSGYCILNDLIIAAHRLMVEGVCREVAIVDVDVHAGDGTSAMAAADARLHCFSIHCQSNFPVRKPPSDVDVGLPDGVEDEAYLEELSMGLRRFETGLSERVDVVLVQAGVDPLHTDRLGRLSLTRHGLMRRNTMLWEWARSLGVPVCATLGGGYAKDEATWHAMCEAHVDVIAGLREATMARQWPVNA